MANIYIVEDDTNIQEIEAIALKNSGHSVEQFDDAAHFYKKLEEKLPDLAILDLMLPDEDGYEIVKKLRQNPATKKLPVIMVTAKTSEIDMVRGLDIRAKSPTPIIMLSAKSEDNDKILGLNIGADDYIKKPFSIIEFITRVKAILRRTLEQPDDKYMTIGDIFLDNERHVVYVDNKGIELTYKEENVVDIDFNRLHQFHLKYEVIVDVGKLASFGTVFVVQFIVETAVIEKVSVKVYNLIAGELIECEQYIQGAKYCAE